MKFRREEAVAAIHMWREVEWGQGALRWRVGAGKEIRLGQGLV